MKTAAPQTKTKPPRAEKFKESPQRATLDKPKVPHKYARRLPLIERPLPEPAYPLAYHGDREETKPLGTKGRYCKESPLVAVGDQQIALVFVDGSNLVAWRRDVVRFDFDAGEWRPIDE